MAHGQRQGEADEGAQSRSEPNLFDAEHLQTGLRGRAVRGGAVTLGAQAIRVLLRLAGLALLARLLVPDDFGLVYKVLAVSGLVMMFRSGSLGMATVQRDVVNHRQISTLFWLNIALGAAVALAILGLAPLLAWLYQDPQVMPVTAALAGTALLAGFGVQHQALLRRQMRFGTLAGIDLAGLVLGLVSAIAAAGAGWGYWALIIEQYGYAVGRLILVWTLCPWMPGPPRRGTGVRPMLAFGGQLTGSNLLNYLARNADDVLIGRFVGDGALGLYGVAYRILLLPIRTINGPLAGVAIPTLSRLQHQPERFCRYYYQALALLTAATMPMVGLCFAEAPRLVRLLLGPDWLQVADFFRALGPAAFIGTFNVATGWVFVSLGRTDRQVKWTAVSAICNVTAFVVGLPWGALGVAVAFSIVQVSLRPFALVYCYHGTSVTLRGLGTALARPCAATLGATALTMIGARMWQNDMSAGSTVVIAGLVYLLAYAALWLVVPGGWSCLRELIGHLRDLRSHEV